MGDLFDEDLDQVRVAVPFPGSDRVGYEVGNVALVDGGVDTRRRFR